MAKEWHQTPAQLMGVTDDPWVAWCLNEAVFMFGRHVEYAMDTAEKGMTKAEQRSAARQRALDHALGTQSAKGTKGRFRDPADMFR